MRKPIIAITPKTGTGNQEEQKYCYVFPNFIHCVSACGGIPIQLNNLEGTVSAADVEEILNHVDGVIFSGGPDIHPGLFGEELMDCCGALAPERDALEIPLMQKAIEMNKPVLGVCRGFQVLNVATGGTLYQKPQPIVWRCLNCGYSYVAEKPYAKCPVCQKDQGWAEGDIDNKQLPSKQQKKEQNA